MNGPMGYGYPNQYGGPMNGMGGNMRPAYGAPNGMPVTFIQYCFSNLYCVMCVAMSCVSAACMMLLS
jgi:hypothetical protein